MQVESTKYNCQLCGSDRYNLLHEKTKNYICNNCGFIIVLPRPNVEELTRLHRQEPNVKIEDRQFKIDEETAKSKFLILERKLEKYLWSPNESRSMLEIGCKTGSFLRLFRACGWKVIGVESDPVYAKVGQERYFVPIQNQSLENFEFTEQFDLICSFNVIEKIENLNTFLAKIHRLLRDRGYLYLESICLDRWYKKPYKPLFNKTRLNTLTQKNLLAFLAKNGFKSTACGWHENRLWIIATKEKLGNLKLSWDNTKRVHRIVEQATSKDFKKRSTNRILAPIYRGIELVKDNPSQLSLKIQQKLQRRFKVFSSINNEPLSAEKVAINPIDYQASKLKIAHVGLHGNFANGGDTLLFPAVRWLFQTNLAPTSFTLIGLRDEVTQETIDEINRHDALLIGGGGLLLADSNPNNLSGWQWACPLELLEQITVPIIVFAIGYNRFRGQSEFTSIFNNSIRKLVEKSIFFGLRNHGSIAAIKNYLPEELHAKLSFQPCPTTVLNRFYPDIPSGTGMAEPIISMNIAFDRHHLRFGAKEDEILWTIADTLLVLQKKGWKIIVLNHCAEDKDFSFWYKARGLSVSEVNLFGVSPQTVIAEYAKVSLALGMRGHAQMVPFGLGCPIVSLISHDKLGFFLEDINRPEWGIDVKSADFGNSLIDKIQSIQNNQETRQAQVLQAQDELWKVTLENMRLIKKILLK
jgi:SAM-dependent methyltransferase/polysaccharide pyruvyl transferase WcaK-like protein